MSHQSRGFDDLFLGWLLGVTTVLLAAAFVVTILGWSP